MTRVSKIGCRYLLLIIMFEGIAFSQSFTFAGPDSLNWRGILNADVKPRSGSSPHIAVVTTKGIAIFHDNTWNYVLTNQNFCIDPFECVWYRSVKFSPLADSTILVTADIRLQGEGGSKLISFNYLSGLEYLQHGGAIPPSSAESYSYMYGDSSAIYRVTFFLQKSYNGGLTWVSLPGTVRGILCPRSRAPKLFATYVSQNSPGVQLFSTSTDGVKWDSIFSMQGNFRSASLYSFGDTLFLSTSALPNSPQSLCGIFKSTNGGASWTQTLYNHNVISMTFGDTPMSVYVATTDSIFRSTNAGDNWQGVYVVPFSKIVQILKHPLADTLLVATADSGLFALVGIPVDVRERINPIEGYSLEQNFPNPFNPSTKFVFSISKSDYVSLRVFDMLGREVSKVIDERMTPGTYSKQWTARNLPSGIYFYRLTAGAFGASRKLVLVK